MNYHLKKVYGTLDKNKREKRQLIEFWTSLGVLSKEEAERRTNEALFLLLDEEQNIVGVNTAYPDTLIFPDNRYYFYRTLIHPKHRYSYRIVISMFNRAFELLKEQKDPSAKGLAVSIENPKLARILSRARFHPVAAKRLLAQKFHYAGKDTHAHDLWYRNFFDLS